MGTRVRVGDWTVQDDGTVLPDSRVFIDRETLAVLDALGVDEGPLVHRHRCCDWGIVRDLRINAYVLGGNWEGREPARVRSAFPIGPADGDALGSHVLIVESETYEDYECILVWAWPWDEWLECDGSLPLVDDPGAHPDNWENDSDLQA